MYLDDILIYSRMEEEHLDMISKAFECLQKAGLKIEFSKEQIHYVGYLVSGTSILPLADKIETLMKIKTPTNIKEVTHLFGLMGYYRKFKCNYADIAPPLNCLTRKFQPFVWSPDCQSSFDMLCSCLANTPIIQFPDPNKLNLLFTDASKYCSSGILTQASMDKSNEILVWLLSNNNPLNTVESPTQNLKLYVIWFTL